VQGDSLLELGRYRAAGRAFQHMVDILPGLPSYARISYLRELRGDIPGAIDAMKQAFDSAGTPNGAGFAAFHLGDLFLNRGRIVRAEAWYTKGAKTAPTATAPIAGLAKIAATRGDLDKAISLVNGLLKINEEPGNAFFLGDLNAAAGYDRAAADAYDLGKRLDAREEANGTDVNLEASLFAADHGRPDEALRLAREEYGIRRSVHVADAYAWALYSNGRYQQAQRLSKESFRLGTRSALFNFHAGMIAEALGQRARAIRHLSTALSLNPIFSFEHRATAQGVLHGLTSTSGKEHR
jgi:tetratricopeptide (TPR) repeat protein